MAVSQDLKFKNFGDRLREAIYSAGIKPADIARDLGVSQNAVSGWVRSIREPKFEVLEFLFQKYGINPLYVIAGEGPPLLAKDEKGVISVLDLIRKKKLRKTKNYCASAIAF